MVKLKAPLMSLKAQGRLSKLFSLAKRQGLNIIERRPIPVDAQSPAQLFNRHMFTKCVDLWHLLSSAEQHEWESLARPRHMSGYAWYISQCLRPNPGIYLPLQGGKMSGDIDMDGNKIEDLPDPVQAQEAATKAYADTHGMQPHENTHVAGGTDDIDSALAIAAMAGLANTKIWQGNAGGRPVPVDLPTPGAVLTVAETEVFNGNSPNPSAWTDLDLSAVVGANVALVLLKINNSVTSAFVAVRKNGDTDEFYNATYISGAQQGHTMTSGTHVALITATDNAGKIEWKMQGVDQACTIDIIAYIK